ncbi:MAG: alpha/beta hydrolase [Deferribacteres bacterium]|nr:alpha/beta hydrolase [candidate division KSB1 bacterium]MCB9501633.1 alpha/beta hydrolase [Deferribacteres bacterium]
MIRKIFVFLSFLLAATVCFGQDYTLSLWDENIPNFKNTYESEIREFNKVLSVGNVQNPDITVFLPSAKMATGQAVVICPGGGYGRLAFDREGTDIAKWLNSHGIAGIVLKYRLPNSNNHIVPHKSPLLDAQRAIRLVRHHAVKWNIEADQIGIMGFSAGGHLASTAGTHFDSGNKEAEDPIDKLSCRPDFMILMYPVISMSQPFMHRGSQRNLLGEQPDSALTMYYSNDLQITGETPPTILFHASDDKAVPVENSLVFYRALVEKGVPAEMHIYPTGGHGFCMATGNYYLETWPDRCADWLKSQNK